MKDLKSYMMGTLQGRIKLIENGEELFVWPAIEAKGPPKLVTFFHPGLDLGNFFVQKINYFDETTLDDLHYSRHLDCYLLCLEFKIYRKNLDGKPAFLFVDLKIEGMIGSSFILAKTYPRFILSRKRRDISLINLETRKMEISFPKDHGGQVVTHHLLDEQERHLLILTHDAHVVLYDLFPGDEENNKNHLLSSKKIAFSEERKEEASNLSVGPEGEYLFVLLGTLLPMVMMTSRILILKIEGGRKLSDPLREVDFLHLGLGPCNSTACFGLVRNHLLFVGICYKEVKYAVLYDFDVESRKLKEVPEKRVLHQASHPLTTQKVGDDLYYPGADGKVFKMALNV